MGGVRTRCYRKGVLDAEDFPLADISDRLAQADSVVWVDFVAPGADDLAPLSDELGLHGLAIEDALEPHQRPKIDRYPSHLFLSCHAVDPDAPGGDLHKTEVDAFVGDRWLVTVRASDAYSMAPVLGRWDGDPELVATGAGALVYWLLDDIVDGYVTAIDRLDAYYDAVSDSVFADQPLGPDQQREWFEARRKLSQFHRLVLPLREALSGLVRREDELSHPQLAPYWQDLYDHMLVVSESTDSLRDLATSLVDANLALRDYRQNQVMKTVSSWAAIVAVPTLITGYYGMNVPFPGFDDAAGVVTSTVLIVLLPLGLYLLFRRRGWL